jgi:cation/acetate symporter
VIGGIYAKGIEVAFLVGLAFAIAASANLPSILYSLFWQRFTERGALWSIYGGLITSVGLIVFSPVISGASSSLITDRHVNFAFFPLNNPGIVAIPVAFFLGWLGTVTDRRPADSARFARMQVRALTGVGAERGGRA